MKIRARLLIVNLLIGIIPILLIFSLFLIINRRQAGKYAQNRMVELIDQFQYNLEKDANRFRELSFFISLEAGDTNGDLQDNLSYISVNRLKIRIYEVYLETNLVYREMFSWTEDEPYFSSPEMVDYMWDYLSDPAYTVYFFMSFPEIVSNVVVLRNCSLIFDKSDTSKQGFSCIVTPLSRQYLYEMPFLSDDYIFVIMNSNGNVFSDEMVDVAAFSSDIAPYRFGEEMDGVRTVSSAGKRYYFLKDTLYQSTEKISNRIVQTKLAEVGVLYDFEAVSRYLSTYRKVSLIISIFSSIIIVLLSYLISNRISKPLNQLKEHIEVFEKEMIPIRKPPVMKDEIGEIHRSFSAMSLSIVEKTEEIKKRDNILNNELKMAGDIQVALLPYPIPEWNNIRISTRYFPLFDVGGDFYDVFDMPRKKLGVIIADASGHGMPAAIYTIVAKRAFYKAAMSFSSPRKILEAVNNELMEVEQAGHYLSASLITFDGKGKLSFGNAGHPAPLLIRKNGTVEYIEDRGTFLGAFDFANETYSNSSLSFEKGDRILMYTDCLYEATNSRRKQYGVGRIYKYVQKHSLEDIETIIEGLLEDLHRYIGNQKLMDDLTIVGIEHA